MIMREWKDRVPLRAERFASVLLIGALSTALALADDARVPELDEGILAPAVVWPSYVIPGEPELSTLYADGSEIVIQTEQRWTLMCGSNPTNISNEDLRAFAEHHAEALRTGPVVIIDTPRPERTTAINIVFSTDGSVPAQAVTALTLVEAYLESLFADPITVTIPLTFQNMGDPSVIGATSPSYVNGVSYTNSKNGLINGMDSDDTLQTWLPTTSTVPVRYNGSTDTITNVSSLSWTRANYRATIGTTTGNAASMTFNTQFSFDYDPSNGISGSTMSFVDVALHETGHALGFVSATDSGTGMQGLDLFRFQRTDGTQDYNPDTLAEFQVRPRLVSYNSPDDDHNTDLISAEYRMSDGDPWQASHFREQTSPWIGLMDPAFTYGETHYPNYFSTADLNVFDAIGYDYPPCEVPQFTQQPANTNVCSGTNAQFTCAVDIPSPGYQWRIGTTNLVDDGVHIFGATTATVTIANVTLADVSDQYNCLVTNLADGCIAASNLAFLGVYSSIEITQQPVDVTISEYQNASFNVIATGSPTITYQWRRNGVNLTNGPNYAGVTSAYMAVLSAEAFHAGFYDCVVTNQCGSVISGVGHLIVNTGYGAGRGDTNCSGSVTFADINPFILALTGGEDQYYPAFPMCHFYNADINSDGMVSFSDINPFVLLLTSSTP